MLFTSKLSREEKNKCEMNAAIKKKKTNQDFENIFLIRQKVGEEFN